MQRSALTSCAALALVATLLGGCETWTNVKRGLGMEKVVPDEFAVTATAPLAVPPDFTLRPPQPGAGPTQQLGPTDQAKQTVFRASDNKIEGLRASNQFSAGEDALLKSAGADSQQQNIRQVLTADQRKAADGSNAGFTDKLLFWKSSDQPAPANTVIDPNFENDRLRQSSGAKGGIGATASNAGVNTSAAAGSAVTATPTIERTKETHFWDWLF